jgi:hypothetical protein
MNHQQLLEVLVRNVIPAGEKPMLWSPPGMGKTALAEQVRAHLTQLTSTDWDLHCWDMTHLYDPADSRGIPTVHTLDDGRKVTRWVTPEHMVIDGKPTLVLLDDLPTLPQSSQAACYRLLQHGEIGGTTFGKNVVFMGAGNRMGDNSATNAMPFALANRLVHFNLNYTLDGWCQWGLANGVPTEVIAFHRFTRGAKLYPIYNESESAAQPCGLCRENVQPGAICPHCVKRSRALPTLRSWGDGVSRLLSTKPSPDVELELYAGKIGKETAAEFCGYLRMYRQIPSIESIILGPSAAPIPTEPSVLYAVATALGRIASPTNFDAVVEYLERLPQQEFAAVTVKDAARRSPDVQHTRAYMSWATRHQDLMS